eukprot:2649939-Rhodomonas_salina.2
MRLEEAMNLHQVKDMELFLRLVPAQVGAALRTGGAVERGVFGCLALALAHAHSDADAGPDPDPGPDPDADADTGADAHADADDVDAGSRWRCLNVCAGCSPDVWCLSPQQHDVHDKFAVNPDLTQMQVGPRPRCQ